MSETAGRPGKASPAKAPGKTNPAAKGRAKKNKRAAKPVAEATGAKKSTAAPAPNAAPASARRPIETPPAMDAAAESAAGGGATAAETTASAAARPVAAPPVKPRGTFPAVLWTVALIAVAVGAAYAARPFWLPQLAEILLATVEDPPRHRNRRPAQGPRGHGAGACRNRRRHPGPGGRKGALHGAIDGPDGEN